MPIRILPKDEKPKSWITKKKPKSWITKKEKPKSWITKKKKPTEWITKKDTTRSTLTGTDTTRGGGPDEGNVGHNKELISRHRQHRKNKPEWIKKKPKSWITKKSPNNPKLKGGYNPDKQQDPKSWIKLKRPEEYKAGGRIGLKHGGPEGKPHSTEEGRRAEAQRAYMRKHGPQKPRRKTLAVTDKYKEVREKRKFSEAGFKPLRAKHGVGSIVKGIKKIVSKALKPKGVFKPKGKVDQKFLDFIRTGKSVDKHGVKVNVAKAAERLTGKPHVDHGIRKKIKHLGKGKAEGGRIGFKKGSVHKPGTHSWYLQHMNKNKKASGGRANFRHGGSVGAAVRGHGAEIK